MSQGMGFSKTSKYLAEAIATFCLVFTGCGVVAASRGGDAAAGVAAYKAVQCKGPGAPSGAGCC